MDMKDTHQQTVSFREFILCRNTTIFPYCLSLGLHHLLKGNTWLKRHVHQLDEPSGDNFPQVCCQLLNAPLDITSIFKYNMKRLIICHLKTQTKLLTCHTIVMFQQLIIKVHVEMVFRCSVVRRARRLRQHPRPPQPRPLPRAQRPRSAQTQRLLQLHKQVVFPENFINNGVGSRNGLTRLGDLGPTERLGFQLQSKTSELKHSKRCSSLVRVCISFLS